jgi:hypothetical protein
MGLDIRLILIANWNYMLCKRGLADLPRSSHQQDGKLAVGFSEEIFKRSGNVILLHAVIVHYAV